MAVCAPTTRTIRLRCTRCGAHVTYRCHIRETGRQPGSVTFTVTTARDDMPWLVLFDQAHQGPLERMR